MGYTWIDKYLKKRKNIRNRRKLKMLTTVGRWLKSWMKKIQLKSELEYHTNVKIGNIFVIQDKLKAMAIYQRQYMSMKKHFYEIEEEKEMKSK